MSGAGPTARPQTTIAERLEAIFREAVKACDPEILTGASLVRDGESLEIHRHVFRASETPGAPPRLGGKGAALSLSLSGGRVGLIACGKAAAGMARAVRACLGDRLGPALVVVPEGGEVPAIDGMEVVVAAHPIPDARSIEAAKKALALAASLTREDLLVAAISGGTSALLAAPAEGLSLSDKMATTRLLLASGADIGAINAVRKHLSTVKGGRLAAATKASVLGLLLSDVAGDPPDVIGSGPVSPDPTTFADAIAVLDRYGLGERVPSAVRAHLEAGARGDVPETPKPDDDAIFSRARTAILAGPEHLRAAALALTAAQGFQGAGTSPAAAGMEVEALATEIAETARRTREQIAARAPKKPLLWAWVREPSVVVKGDGVGGRNAHLALLVARAIAGMPGVTFLSAGSDGIDGNSAAAGAIVDGGTWERARARGLDPEAALARFDAAPLLAALDAAIVTGRTGTNFMDLHLLAIEPAAIEQA